MSTRGYWQQGAQAYRDVKHQQTMERLDAELHAIIAKQSSYPCQCEKVDAHHCYADTHDTVEIDDDKFCRCRCHKTDDF